MGVEGCTKCIKYLLFVFNFVFWVSGVFLGLRLLRPGLERIGGGGRGDLSVINVVVAFLLAPPKQRSGLPEEAPGWRLLLPCPGARGSPGRASLFPPRFSSPHPAARGWRDGCLIQAARHVSPAKALCCIARKGTSRRGRQQSSGPGFAPKQSEYGVEE